MKINTKIIFGLLATITVGGVAYLIITKRKEKKEKESSDSETIPTNQTQTNVVSNVLTGNPKQSEGKPNIVSTETTISTDPNKLIGKKVYLVNGDAKIFSDATLKNVVQDTFLGVPIPNRSGMEVGFAYKILNIGGRAFVQTTNDKYVYYYSLYTK